MIRALAALALALLPQDPPAPAWTVTEGLSGPESAYFDSASGALFVSNVAGEPAKKDGEGWISKLTLDGKVTAAKWVSGLNAPKGLRSHHGTLWVSDIDEIVGISIAEGKVVHRVAVAGAKFLNDVACGPDGTVYVSDMMGTRIFQLKDGKVSVFAEGEDLEYPNGLLVEGDRLVVAAWGKPEADFSTKVPGRLYALDLATKKKTLITPEPVGNLDGVESDGKHGYILTDWVAGKVIHSHGGHAHPIFALKQGTADHAFLADRKLLVLPLMLENKVVAYDLSKVLH